MTVFSQCLPLLDQTDVRLVGRLNVPVFLTISSIKAVVNTAHIIKRTRSQLCELCTNGPTWLTSFFLSYGWSGHEKLCWHTLCRVSALIHCFPGQAQGRRSLFWFLQQLVRVYSHTFASVFSSFLPDACVCLCESCLDIRRRCRCFPMMPMGSPAQPSASGAGRLQHFLLKTLV